MERADILKVKKHRNFKITNSLGVYDAYKWLRRNKWLDVGAITEHDFYAIIRTVNKALIEDFLKAGEITFPHRMGKLLLRKYHSDVKFKDGKVVTNLPIDWDRTLSLWESDNISRTDKTLIRKEEDFIFKIFYNKTTANYNNKSFYTFKCNRAFKLKIKEAIQNNKIDAYILCGKI